MGLVQVDTFTVSSAVASVIIGGGSSGSSSTNFAINTDDVYMLTISNYQPETDNTNFRLRVTVSGTADSSSNYDYTGKFLANPNFFNHNSQGQAQFQGEGLGTATGEVGNHIMYLYNFNNSSEYSFITVMGSSRDASGNQLGFQGAISNEVTQACDGIQLSQSSGNIASGTVTLYKVV